MNADERRALWMAAFERVCWQLFVRRLEEQAEIERAIVAQQGDG